MYAGVGVLTCYNMHVRVKKQLLGVSSLLPPCRYGDSNSGFQTLLEASLFT